MARTEDSHLAKQQEMAGAPPGELPGASSGDSMLPDKYPPVSVRDISPALSVARCVGLSAANPVLPALPQDPRRRRAVLLAVDADVWVSSSKDIASGLAALTAGADAFYLPKGVPLVAVSRGALYAAYTTLVAGVSRVSVLVERDDD